MTWILFGFVGLWWVWQWSRFDSLRHEYWEIKSMLRDAADNHKENQTRLEQIAQRQREVPYLITQASEEVMARIPYAPFSMGVLGAAPDVVLHDTGPGSESAKIASGKRRNSKSRK